MKEITVKGFAYSELSDDAKERARQWVLEGFWDTGYGQEEISEMFAIELSERGLDGLINDRSPVWSLSNSQGDGVAFAGTIDLSEIKPIVGHGAEEDARYLGAIRSLLEDLDPNNNHFSVRVYSIDNHYAHWNTFRVEVEDLREFSWGEDGYPEWTEELQRELDKFAESLEGTILEWLQYLSRYLEKKGYEIIEYRESEESILEECEANEWLFSERGEYIGHLQNA